MSKINHELCGQCPETFDKLEMIDDLVEYELMMITLAEAMGIAKAEIRARLVNLSYDTIRALYDDTFLGNK